MEYIPGSHKLDQIPHRDTFAKHNLLTRGQEVMVEVDHPRRRVITLRPGEMSLHHVRLVHGSPPKPFERPAHRLCHPLYPDERSRDLDPDFVALHRSITECGARFLYRGTDVASYNAPKALAQRG
jgi:non-heme Fe2+,alpha-ketoglutarate-dependent halogenase